MRRAKPQFAICIRNDECDDLEVRRVYRVLPDPAAAAEGYLRVIDESGEDYVYPTAYFVPIDVPRSAERILSPTRSRAASAASSVRKRSARRAG